jgi:hypothetical protein
MVDVHDKIVGFVGALFSKKGELATSFTKLSALQTLTEVVASIESGIKFDFTLVLSKARSEASTKAATAAMRALVSIERINHPSQKANAAIERLCREILAAVGRILVGNQLVVFRSKAEPRLYSPLFSSHNIFFNNILSQFYSVSIAFGETHEKSLTLSKKMAKKLLAPSTKAINAVCKEIRAFIFSVKAIVNQAYLKALDSDFSSPIHVHQIVKELTCNFDPGSMQRACDAAAVAQQVLNDLEPQIQARYAVAEFFHQFTVVLLGPMIHDFQKLHSKIARLAVVAAPGFGIPEKQAVTVAQLFANKVLAPAHEIIHSVNQAIAKPFLKLRGEFEIRYAESRLTASSDEASLAAAQSVNQLLPGHVIMDLLMPIERQVRVTGVTPDANFSFDYDEEYFQVVADTLAHLDSLSALEAEANPEIISDLYRARNLALRARLAFDSFSRPLFRMFDEHEVNNP